MELYALFVAVRNAVARDAALAAWATAEFTKNVRVFSGLVSKWMPEPEDDAPFIVLGDPSESRGAERRTILYEISGWIGLWSGDVKAGTDANVTEADGTEQIAEALNLVRDAIFNNLPDGVELIGWEIASDTLGATDEVNGYFAVQFERKLMIGESPF